MAIISYEFNDEVPKATQEEFSELPDCRFPGADLQPGDLVQLESATTGSRQVFSCLRRCVLAHPDEEGNAGLVYILGPDDR